MPFPIVMIVSRISVFEPVREYVKKEMSGIGKIGPYKDIDHVKQIVDHIVAIAVEVKLDLKTDSPEPETKEQDDKGNKPDRVEPSHRSPKDRSV